MKNIAELLEKEKENIVKLRREFHRCPEPCWKEFWTTSKIVHYLEETELELYFGRDIINKADVMNYPSAEEISEAKNFAEKMGGDLSYLEKSEGYTGVGAVLDTGKPGKTTVLRFDIDCNEITESSDDSHIPYKEGFISQNPGNAHCCGHDGHIAIGITTAKILSQMKENLTGKIIFIFQSGEESVAGGKSFANGKLFNGADYFLTAHIGIKALDYSVEMIGVKGFLATKKIDVEFLGCSSHAGVSPEQGKNAILAACSATTAMYTICQDGRGARRVNIGYIRGGSARNIVAEKVTIKMEVRGETTEICEDVFTQCMAIIKSAGDMYGVKTKVKIIGEAPCAESDRELTDLCEEVIKELYPSHKILKSCDFGASEDATFMMNRTQSQGGKAEYVMLGSEIAAPHHNAKFDFNEDTLIKGVNIFVNMVCKTN